MRENRPFYLVQRLQHRPYKKPDPEAKGLKAKLGNTNPFGYGRMGDYELDYMGSAEFEFGTIPKANNRLAEAKKGLVLLENEAIRFNDHDVEMDFLYIKKDGNPIPAFDDWIHGRGVDNYYDPPRYFQEQPFYGKETAYELERQMKGETEPEWGWRAHVWWALTGDVIFALSDLNGTRHLHQMLESMGTAPVAFTR